MAKTRMINTRFWNDGYISELNPIEKLLFLYLLTNQATSICGIYELPIRTMVFETGIEEQKIRDVLSRFSVDGKMEYWEGWVVIKNFIKHQNQHSPQIIKGIRAELENVPEKLKGYIKGIDTLSHSNSNSNSNSNINSNTSAPKVADEVNPVIDLFKEINPSYTVLFRRKPQREAAQRLSKLHGPERLKNVIGYIQAHSGQRYLPTITTPCQLEDKWASLEAFAKKQKTADFVL